MMNSIFERKFRDREYGIELEISQIQGSAARTIASKATGWSSKSDGSIPDSGMEIISPKCSKVKMFEDLPKIIKESVRQGGRIHWDVRGFATLVSSNQQNRQFNCCSLHVHIDASELSKPQLAAICIAYNALYKGVKANFPTILPQVEAELDLQDWSVEDQEMKKTKKKVLVELRDKCYWAKNLVTNGMSTQKVYDNWGDNDRYLSVNMAAKSKHGTVEFRQGMLTWNVDEIKLWIEYLTDLINFAEMLPGLYGEVEPKKNKTAGAVAPIHAKLAKITSEEISGIARMHFLPWIERAQKLKPSVLVDMNTWNSASNNGPEEKRCPDWFCVIDQFSLLGHYRKKYEEMKAEAVVKFLGDASNKKMIENIMSGSHVIKQEGDQIIAEPLIVAIANGTITPAIPINVEIPELVLPELPAPPPVAGNSSLLSDLRNLTFA